MVCPLKVYEVWIRSTQRLWVSVASGSPTVPHLKLLCVPAVELKLNLDQYVSKRYPGLVKIVRNSRREGLIRARLQGWKVATAPVVGFFDAHVEFSTGW